MFAFPSTREGFGMVALEANASGIPFVTTDHKDNATKDLIYKGKNGDIFQLDEKDIADKVKKYLSLGKTNNNYQSYIKNYDWNDIARKIDDVYAND